LVKYGMRLPRPEPVRLCLSSSKVSGSAIAETETEDRRLMSQDLQEASAEQDIRADVAEPLPFPFNQRTYCRYESIEKTIDEARVLIVDNLLRDEGDLSDIARADWGQQALAHLKRERRIALLALQNIVS